MYICYCFTAESCPVAGTNIPIIYDHNVLIADGKGEDLYHSFKCILISFSQKSKELVTV